MTAGDRIRFAFATALLAVGCGGEDVEPLVGGPFEGVDFDHAITNVRELVSTAGIRRATVLGDTAYVYEESGSTEIVGVRVTMYDERGAQTGSLTADRGELGENREVMMASGNVVVITEDGRRIETEELHYHPQEDRVWSDVATTLHQENSTVHGTGFTSDANFQRLRVREPTGRVEGLEPAT